MVFFEKEKSLYSIFSCLLNFWGSILDINGQRKIWKKEIILEKSFEEIFRFVYNFQKYLILVESNKSFEKLWHQLNPKHPPCQWCQFRRETGRPVFCFRNHQNASIFPVLHASQTLIAWPCPSPHFKMKLTPLHNYNLSICI